MRRRRGYQWTRRRSQQQQQPARPHLRRRRAIPAAHLAYFLRDRRGNVGNHEYLVVWHDLFSETWEPGNQLAVDGWANEMLHVDRWVHTQRRIPFLHWARAHGIQIEGAREHQQRVVELWTGTGSPLPIRDWADLNQIYYVGANLGRPRRAPRRPPSPPSPVAEQWFEDAAPI